jgi:hypothetical protein
MKKHGIILHLSFLFMLLFPSALMFSQSKGLKTIMQDSSYYQFVPVTVTEVFQPGTRITISGEEGERISYYRQAFGGNFSESGSYQGSVVFAGLGISDPANGWDDLKDLDLKGKIVIILDALRPGYLG